MRFNVAASLVVASLFAGDASAQLLQKPLALPDHNPKMEPDQLASQYFNDREFAKLEDAVAGFVKSGTRTDDGRYALYMLTRRIDNNFKGWGEQGDAFANTSLEVWRKQFPESAFEPIISAMHVYSTGWRARGTGAASSVASEGWKLFAERNARAWKILQDSKERASKIPSWYELAIRVGFDLHLPDDELREIFDEGMRKHPGYHGLYMTFIRQFTPRWGGDYESADEFIVEQTAAKSNREGEILYTQLYLRIDYFEDGPQSLFEDSKISWPRMRRGFESLMATYPQSELNLANFAIFACRARDATTYGKLRPIMDTGKFDEVAPNGISVEVCDARFMKKA